MKTYVICYGTCAALTKARAAAGSHRDDERAAIVAWLRACVIERRAPGFHQNADALEAAADAIERGEHTKTKEMP